MDFIGSNGLHGFVNLDRKYAGTKVVGFNRERYTCISRFSHKLSNDIGDMIDWEDLPVYGGHWENRGEHFNPIFVVPHHFGGRMRSMLVDVDLKVQASYKKKCVPIVSLVSKVNRMAIIGHPIQIEALVPPVWRTARRTNFRVPRPDLSSMLGGDNTVEDIPFMERERRMPFKKTSAMNFGHKHRLVVKSLPLIPRPPNRKFSRKLLKKLTSPSISNKKTRTLSSFTVPVYDSCTHMDELLKPETSGPTTVACIPVKLVFSRLREKINRPPSKATTNVVMQNTDGERL